MSALEPTRTRHALRLGTHAVREVTVGRHGRGTDNAQAGRQRHYRELAKLAFHRISPLDSQNT